MTKEAPQPAKRRLGDVKAPRLADLQAPNHAAPFDQEEVLCYLEENIDRMAQDLLSRE
jgi:hypothetical protein